WAGAAYLFTRNGSSWRQQFYLKAAISGDFMAAAARYEESRATGINGDQNDNSQGTAGAVYAYAPFGIRIDAVTHRLTGDRINPIHQLQVDFTSVAGLGNWIIQGSGDLHT